MRGSSMSPAQRNIVRLLKARGIVAGRFVGATGTLWQFADVRVAEHHEEGGNA